MTVGQMLVDSQKGKHVIQNKLKDKWAKGWITARNQARKYNQPITAAKNHWGRELDNFYFSILHLF